MSLEEIGVVTLCLFGGYWVVSFLFSRGRPRPGPGTAPPPPSEPETGGAAAHWAEVLGVSPDASAEEIRRAYQQRIGEYHPDKVATLGPEMRDLAERKSQAINVAFDEARRVRGGPP